MWWLKLIGVYLFGTGLAQVAASLQRLRGQASAPQPFQPPTVATGTPISVLYGTAPVQPIMTWLGDVATDPVFNYDNPLIGGVIHFAGPQQVKVGDAYRVTMQGILGWGVMSPPINILFGERRLLTNEPVTQRIQVQGPTTADVGYITVPTQTGSWDFIEPLYGGRKTVVYAAPTVFGGLGRGGGFGARFNQLGLPIGGGAVTFAIGTRQYGPDPVMQARINPGGVSDPANNVPAYGDLAYVVYENVVVGESPTPPSVRYVCARVGDHPIPDLVSGGLTTTRSIQNGSDPSWNVIEVTHIAMLYDAMRSPKYGAGVPEWKFDPTILPGASSWKIAAQTLFDEGIYGSWLVGGDGRQLSLRDIKDEVERVVDGQLVRDPETFKWKFTLNRAEDPASLPAFDERHMRNLEWHEAQPSEVINQVTVEFYNAAKRWALDTVTLTDHGSVNEIGLKRQTIRFVSVTDPAVALKLCARELRRGSAKLRRGKAIGTRVFWSAERGNCFKLSNAKYNLGNVVVRISSIDYGTPENGEIPIEFVEDLFGLDAVTYSGPETPPVVTIASIIRPAVTRVASSLVGVDQSIGQVTITLVDPQHRVIEVAFNRQSGDSPATDWTVVASATPDTADPTFPYNSTVTLGDLNGDYVSQVALPAEGTASIAYRVRYIATSVDDIQEITGESQPFNAPRPLIPSAPTIALSVAFVGGAPVVTASVSPGVARVRFLGSLSATPTRSDVHDNGVVKVTPPLTYVGPVLSSGQTWYVGAEAEDGNGQTAFASISAPFSVSNGSTLFPIVGSKLWMELPVQGKKYTDAGVTLATTSAQALQQWNDVSGNDRHATQADAAHRPVLDTTIVHDGNPTTRYDGDQWFELPDMSVLNDEEVEVFIVTKTDNDPAAAVATSGLCYLGGESFLQTHYPGTDGPIYLSIGSAERVNFGDPATSLSAQFNVLSTLSYPGAFSGDGYSAALNGSALPGGPLLANIVVFPSAPLLGAMNSGSHAGARAFLLGNVAGFAVTARLTDDERAAVIAALTSPGSPAEPPPESTSEAILILKGSIDASTNPDYPAADAAHVYKISVAGRIGGASGVIVQPGDTIYCLTDATPTGDQATVGDQWVVLHANPVGTGESGRWEPVTNGDPLSPELIFAGGDVVMAFRPS